MMLYSAAYVGDRKGVAVALPDFSVLHRIIIFCNRNAAWLVN